MKISPAELHDTQSNGKPRLILDVLPEDAFAARHIPGAVNACVYEVVFLETVAGATGGDKSTPLAVYDETNTFETANLAAERLTAAGHEDVAVLEITGVSPVEARSDGLPNTRIAAELSLHGKTGKVEFPCLVGRGTDGGIVAQGNFDIDRTAWDIRYGSGRFFEWLGKHIVSDLISLQVKVVVAKEVLNFD